MAVHAEAQLAIVHRHQGRLIQTAIVGQGVRYPLRKDVHVVVPEILICMVIPMTNIF